MSQLEEISEADLAHLTPVGARALVVRCFLNAQRETLVRAARTLNSTPGANELQKLVEGAVRLAFRKTQGDYEHPSKPALAKVVEHLAGQAAAMGTPPDIIEHHRKQLGRVFAALPDDAAAA